MTAAVCGSVAYWLVSDLRRSAAEATFESLAATAVVNAVHIAERKVRGGDVLTSVLRHAFPRPDPWPLVYLPGFEETARLVAAQSSSTTALGLVAVLRPAQDDVEAFEAMALQVYDAYGYAAGAGVYNAKNGSFGIFANGPNGTRYHDTTGTTSWGSNRTILTPIFQRSNQNANGLLLNVHAEPFRGRAIDSILQCTDDANDANANDANATTTELPSCGVVTDFIELFVAPGRPAALLYQPVYVTSNTNTSNDTNNNDTNNTVSMVAMIGHSIFWEEVLRDVVPSYVSGLECVLTSSTIQSGSEQPPQPQPPQKSFTYVLEDGGVPRLRGPGDLHDARYDRWARTAVLTQGARHRRHRLGHLHAHRLPHGRLLLRGRAAPARPPLGGARPGGRHCLLRHPLFRLRRLRAERGAPAPPHPAGQAPLRPLCFARDSDPAVRYVHSICFLLLAINSHTRTFID